MLRKVYLVYLDILGFKKLPSEIAEKSGFDEDIIRQNYLSEPIKKMIDKVREKAISMSQGISEIEGSDNYVLLVDSIPTAFELVENLTTIRIPHNDYKFVPLEVALDVREIDEAVEVEPINRGAIIDFLKNDIISPYRRYYKNNNNGVGIRETFVLLTQKFFDDLAQWDKKYAEKIDYAGKPFFRVDVERIRQRARVFQFLKDIGYEGDKWYERIDDIYVPPLEYEELKSTLKEKRFLFIVGTQEYGKTYTAVRLMWEYYQQGYEPRWIRGGDPPERAKLRQRLEKITSELKPRRIVYFEDPFGKEKYEKREGLEREIGTIIDSIRQLADAYVIITSREEVFKEFEREMLSSKVLEEFKRGLNIKKPSYDYKKRKEILLDWVEEANCKWLRREDLKRFVLDSICDNSKLPTPLTMKDFALTTAGIEEEEYLKKEISLKSTETAWAFAAEIRKMTDDKILFLFFPFISEYFGVSSAKSAYWEMVMSLNIEDALGFNQVLDWFKDDKISISEGRLRFSHSSYSEALKYLLAEDYHFTQEKKIFISLLLRLTENYETAWMVARAVALNYDWLRDEVGNLLFQLAEKDGTATEVARAVAENFDRLPDDVRNKLLLKLAEKDGAAWEVAHAVAKYFCRLTNEVRSLLFQLAEKDETAWMVAYAVASNFGELPDDARNLLFKLFEKDDKTALYVVRAVAENFDRLPDEVRNLLFQFAEKDDEAAGAVAWAVAEYFDRLPDEARNLLFQLAEKDDETAEHVAFAVAHHFERLPDDMRNKLLLKLAEKDMAAWIVVKPIAENFDRLPDDVRNLLFKLAEKDGTAGDVADAVARHFKRLPDDVRSKILLKLDEKYIVAPYFAHAIGDYVLSKDLVFDVLQKLSENEDQRTRVRAQKLMREIFGNETGH